MQLEMDFKNTYHMYYSIVKPKYLSIIDENLTKVGSELIWISIESETKNILPINIPIERNYIVVENFLSNIVYEYKSIHFQPICCNWYPKIHRILKLIHDIISFVKKNIIERIMRYVKDKANRGFDDYFPCKKKKCKLQEHVKQRLYLFSTT